MIAQIVGPLNAESAAFLVAVCVMLSIVLTALIVHFRSKKARDQDFEIAKLKIHAEDSANKLKISNYHETELAKIAANRELEVRRIDSGMIELTRAHPENTNNDDEG